MVKITNPLGDVKTGRQGEAVYQRKYGEQIRRTVSPKRAIPSQRQIDHRQLYRDALDWRKSLSLANRRYLEGYCIANGVVDGYGVPLAWSRFSLKLYLQKVKFVAITKAIAGTEEKDILYEYYNEGDDNWYKVYSSYWRGQTFTPLVAHKITSVKLRLLRVGFPGTITIVIRATSGGLPTGGDLCVGTTDADTLTPLEPGEWREITLGAGYYLEAGVMYAVIIKGDGFSSSVCPAWRFDGTSPTYTRGTGLYATGGGATWYTMDDKDFMFEEWGKEAAIPPVLGLLHVRHPALLTVVQKRGELTVKGYDTLSSLDGEYLTKQVGLDVHVDDFIEATTLPGIDYNYLVK